MSLERAKSRAVGVSQADPSCSSLGSNLPVILVDTQGHRPPQSYSPVVKPLEQTVIVVHNATNHVPFTASRVCTRATTKKSEYIRQKEKQASWSNIVPPRFRTLKKLVVRSRGRATTWRWNPQN
ncbi:hypothetical protein PM082_011032 [Marasmius tenuissimus]|nr:hypothetical protein PM082_011032 [Marasmius tenuissimus]